MKPWPVRQSFMLSQTVDSLRLSGAQPQYERGRRPAPTALGLCKASWLVGVGAGRAEKQPMKPWPPTQSSRIWQGLAIVRLSADQPQ